jgi:hypothetical protein
MDGVTAQKAVLGGSDAGVLPFVALLARRGSRFVDLAEERDAPPVGARVVGYRYEEIVDAGEFVETCMKRHDTALCLRQLSDS